MLYRTLPTITCATAITAKMIVTTALMVSAFLQINLFIVVRFMMPETARADRINIVQVAQPEQPGIVQIVQPAQPKQPSGLHIMCGSRAGEGCTATGGIVCRIGWAVSWRVACVVCGTLAPPLQRVNQTFAKQPILKRFKRLKLSL